MNRIAGNKECWSADCIRRRQAALVVFSVLLLAPASRADESVGEERSKMTPRAVTVEDFFQMKRVGPPQVSPDGALVVYSVTEVTDSQNNQLVAKLWLVPADSSKEPRLLTNSAAKDSHPRWSPDGKRILFESSRSGSNQLWVIELAGGEARQLTSISTEAGSAVWSADGGHIAFVSAVYPEFSGEPFSESDAKNKARADAMAASPVKARVFSRLFYRHWDSYVEGKRQHLFVIDVSQEADGTIKASPPRDVTPGDRDAYPTSTTFSASQDFCFSPDSSHLVFTAVPSVDEAWSTNFDLCRVPISGGTIEWETLTADNPAADGLPVFSPDGTKLAFRSQRVAGYEADKWEVMLADVNADGSFRSKPVSLTEQTDLSFDEFVWQSKDQLILSAELKGQKPLFQMSVRSPDKLEQIRSSGTTANLSITSDGQVLVCNNSRMVSPTDVFRVNLQPKSADSSAPGVNLSRANEALLAELNLSEPESVTVSGADKTPMQMWILKPPGFDSSKKYALGFLVHGGPQGAWSDSWSFRWNPQIWAAQGYVIAAPNPRGSTGFGQLYTKQISGDWGGRCYVDLMAGLTHMEQQPYVDSSRMFAAGASFGGYMMNWFQGKTTKFRTLITHCGVYNFESMYATTEELWFDEYEHGGPPWGPNRESYENHSPHRLAANFKTPMLIIHNDLDFRVPVSEGHQLFTTLQRLGVPSKFINFPDEGHWVQKPANSRYWHQEIFSWLQKYCPPNTP